MKPIEPFTLIVDDVFALQNGTTVFVGQASTTGPLAPCDVDLEVDGTMTRRLHVESEHWGHPQTPGVRAVATSESVDVTALRGRKVRLVRA